MPFPFTCPSCRRTSQVLEHLAGVRAKCPSCGDVVTIPPVGRPVEGIPTVTPLEDRPPAPRPAPTTGSRGAWIMLLVGGLLFVLCCGGGGLIGLLLGLRETPARSSGSGREPPPTSRASPPNGAAAASDRQLHRQLLKSTAWIMTGDGRRSGIGTATVVHRDQRLLMTNYHLVRSFQRVVVMFPLFTPDGEPITRPGPYFDAAEKKGLVARVVASDLARDLALLQVDELPADAKPLSLSPDGVGDGQRVAAVSAVDRPVGFGEEDGGLWQFERLGVKRVVPYEYRYKDGQRVSARVIEMSAAGDDGGFGGPVIDEQGRLVGVLCDFGKRGTRLAIDVREARAVLQAHFARIGLQWSEGGAAPAPSGPLDVTNNSPAYWLQVLRDANDAKAEQARERIVAMGRAAILELRKALRDQDPKMRLAAASVLGAMGESATGAIADLGKSLTDKDTAVRTTAAQSLGQLGATAHAALPALIVAGTDPQIAVSEASQTALAKVGPIVADDVPKLVPLWSEADAAKRGRYLTMLLAVKPEPAVTGSLLAPLLADPEQKVRLQAIRALEAAGPPAHVAAFGKLLACAGAGEPEVRKAALAALAKLGPAAAADRNALEVGLRSAQREVRLFCAARLGDVGPAAGPSAPDLARLLRDAEPGVRVAAAQALGRIGKPAAIVLPDVMVAAHDPDPNLRAAAYEALGRLSREARVVSMLFDALADDVPAVRDAAGKTLRSLDPPLSRDDVPALRFALRSKAVEARRTAAGELARLGPDAAAAADEMLAAAKDPDYEVRRHAFAVLPLLGEKGKAMLPIVLETMSTILSENGQQPNSLALFRQASVTFAKLGDPIDALPIWSKGLKTRDRTLRKEVVQSLATVGAPARKAARDLCLLLDEADIADAVSETLLALRGEEVVRALSDVLEESPSADAKMAAVRILGKLGPEAKDAYQALFKASQRYAGKELGQAAREALKQIQRK
jgi:HEAT repeat protein